MKKFSILIFTIIILLTPIFFSYALPPVVPLFSVTGISNGVSIEIENLRLNTNYTIVLSEGSALGSSYPINSGSYGTVIKTIKGLTPNADYIASLYLGSITTGDSLVTDYFTTLSTASFNLTIANNDVSKVVTASPAGSSVISCGVTCTSSYDDGTSVTITAPAKTGYTVKMSDGCTAGPSSVGVGASCSVTMTSAKTVAVTYTVFQSPVVLTVNNISKISATINATGLNSFSQYTLKISQGTAVFGTYNSLIPDLTGNLSTTITGLSKGITYTASIYAGIVSTDNLLKTVDFTTLRLLLTPTLDYNNVTSSRVDLIVDGILTDGSSPFKIVVESANDSKTINKNANGIYTIGELESGTNYTASLYLGDSSTASAVKSFTTLLTGTLSSSEIKSNSAKINTDLSINTSFTIYIQKKGDAAGVYFSNKAGTTDGTGTATVIFEDLVPNTTYKTFLSTSTQNNISSLEFKTLLEDPVVTPPIDTTTTPPTDSATLNYAELYINVAGAADRIRLNKEGVNPNNYTVGSKAALSKVLNERYSDKGEPLLNKEFISQSELNLFNTKLKAALVDFEAKKVGPVTIGGNLSSKGGGLVPDCPAGGCGFDELMEMINKIIQFLLFTVATPLAAIIIAYAGWLYLKSGGNPGDITKAKKILLNVVIGYIIGLAAWLIVKTIVSSLGVDPTINTFLK